MASERPPPSPTAPSTDVRAPLSVRLRPWAILAFSAVLMFLGFAGFGIWPLAFVGLVPALYVLQDYNYQTPRLDLTTRFDLPEGYAGGVVEYGTHHGTPDEGSSLAQIRAEERGATRQVYTGRSNLCRFRAGGTCALEGHPWLGARELLLVEVEHRATQATMMDGAVGGERTYTNRFKAIERAVPYRPRRLTPRPRISGLLFGLIEPDPAGELGKYAQIDLEGCYTVRFFFDTSPLGARLRSSLPIRMLQPHAGTNYGMHFPLKPGVEVLVVIAPLQYEIE